MSQAAQVFGRPADPPNDPDGTPNGPDGPPNGLDGPPNNPDGTTGKNVIYHQDSGYLILGLRILYPENFATKYSFRILGSLILNIEDPQSSEPRILNPQDLRFLILGYLSPENIENFK